MAEKAGGRPSGHSWPQAHGLGRAWRYTGWLPGVQDLSLQYMQDKAGSGRCVRTLSVPQQWWKCPNPGLMSRDHSARRKKQLSTYSSEGANDSDAAGHCVPLRSRLLLPWNVPQPNR